jgi:hypothetical protein
VSAIAPNPQLLVSAFLRLVRDQADPQAWAKALLFAALTGNPDSVAETLEKLQDHHAAEVRSDGGSTAWIRGMSCLEIAQLCEAALQTLEAEEAADDDGLSPAAPGSVRHADFSGHPCTLG